MKKLILLAIAMGMLNGCSNPRPDLMSPCVGNDGSPCVRHEVNDWWHPQAG